MTTLFWMIVAFLVGLFLPAPYSDVARKFLRGLWDKFKGLFKSTPIE